MDVLKKNMNQVMPNEYFVKKLDVDAYLITTRHGSWAVLNEKDYDCLKNNVFVDSKLYSYFEEKGFILTEKSMLNISKSLKLQYSFLDVPHILCVVSFTKRCTLKCSYCHVDAVPCDSNISDMDETTIKNIIKFICSIPKKNISVEIQGGEPLLRFDLVKKFFKLLDFESKKCGTKINSRAIVSNFTLMDEEIATYLIENKIGLCTSLDGPKELHDFQRKFVGDGGSFDDVVKWVKYFNKKGKTVGMLPTITSETIKYGPKVIVDLYLELGYNKVNFRSVHNIGRGKNPDVYVDVDDFFNFWVTGIEYLLELNLNGVDVYDLETTNILKNILTPIRPYMCMRNPCGAGISQIAFDVDGSILPCDIARSLPKLCIGDVKKDNYSTAMLSALDIKSRSMDLMPLCDSCVFGPYCGTCVCRSHATHKNIIPKTPIDFDCKLKQKMFVFLFNKLRISKYREIFELWVRK